LPSSLVGSSIRNSFIGDLTGVIGLLPALLTWRKAWERWKEITLGARVDDIGVFVVGLGGAASCWRSTMRTRRNCSSFV